MQKLRLTLVSIALIGITSCGDNTTSTSTTTTTQDTVVGGEQAPSTNATDMSNMSTDSLRNTNSPAADTLIAK